MDIDQRQDKATAFEYPYVPATGNMMYCMPKVGTRVTLYFPDEREENAKVTSCVRTNGGQCQDTADYNKRYFTTEHNKQLAMMPTALSFAAVGSAQSPLRLAMQEEAAGVIPGISFESPKVIRLFAQGNIEFSSDKKIICTANVAYNMGVFGDGTTPKSLLNIKFEFNLLARSVKLETSRFENYPAFDDGFNAAKFWTNVLIGALAVVAIVAVVAVAAPLVVAAVGASAAVASSVVTGAAIGGAVAIGIKAGVDGYNRDSGAWQDYVAKAMCGCICGAISGPASGFWGNVAANAGGTTVGMTGEQLTSHVLGGTVDYNLGDYVIGTVGGGLGGGICYGAKEGIKRVAVGAINKMGGGAIKQVIRKFADKAMATGIGSKKWMLMLTKAYTENNKKIIAELSAEEAEKITISALKGELGEKASINALKQMVKESPEIFKEAGFQVLNPFVKAVPTTVGDTVSDLSGRTMDGYGVDELIAGEGEEAPLDGAEYIVRGAKLRCNKGSVSRKANLPLCHGAYITEAPMLCQADSIPNTNITSFGRCSVDRKVCTPAPIGEWKRVKKDVMINGGCVVTTESWLQCCKGGQIKVEDSGQKVE